MLVILPDSGTFPAFRSGLTAAELASIDQSMQLALVDLSLPRFEIRTATGLSGALEALGMRAAFDSSSADLSGLDGASNLYVQDVVHQAYVSVDEEGTEAAASTAVVVGTEAVEVLQNETFDARQPFLFAIRDNATKAVLFWGQVTNPLE
jgi:serpin B